MKNTTILQLNRSLGITLMTIGGLTNTFETLICGILIYILNFLQTED